MNGLEFRINDFLKLRLEGSKTYIYVNERKFRSCQIVILNTPSSTLSLESFGSMDEFLKYYEEGIGFQDLEDLEISPTEEFWVHCSNIQAWAENDYNTAFLDSYLAFPLLKRLVEAGDFSASVVFKEEVAKRLSSKVPQIIRYLLLEGYDSFLNQEELIYSILNSGEAIALESISKRCQKSYNLVFDFDDLREKFLNIYRGESEILENNYYFSVYNGELYELELILNDNCMCLPLELANFTKLYRLYLYVDSLDILMPEFNISLESLTHLKIFCYGKVRIPKMLQTFPSLELVEIYSNTPEELFIDDEVLRSVVITKL